MPIINPVCNAGSYYVVFTVLPNLKYFRQYVWLMTTLLVIDFQIAWYYTATYVAHHLIPRCVRPGDPGIHIQSINQSINQKPRILLTLTEWRYYQLDLFHVCHGIRVCAYPESVVSHEAIGRMWYDWFRVGTDPYPVNKHGITILSFDHELMNTNLTKWLITHIALININIIIIFNLAFSTVRQGKILCLPQ